MCENSPLTVDGLGGLDMLLRTDGLLGDLGGDLGAHLGGVGLVRALELLTVSAALAWLIQTTNEVLDALGDIRHDVFCVVWCFRELS